MVAGQARDRNLHRRHLAPLMYCLIQGMPPAADAVGAADAELDWKNLAFAGAGIVLLDCKTREDLVADYQDAEMDTVVSAF